MINCAGTQTPKFVNYVGKVSACTLLKVFSILLPSNVDRVAKNEGMKMGANKIWSRTTRFAVVKNFAVGDREVKGRILLR